MNHKKFRKAALAVSFCLFVLWWALGTGATLAWFTDSDSVRNEFQIGLLQLDVSYSHDIGGPYDSLEGTEEAFNDEALYEPGYTQVVYLKIDNLGDVDFNYKVAVTVERVDEGFNAWGDPIFLPNYLRYGVVFAESEPELQELVKDRLTAKSNATQFWGPLDVWSAISPYTFEADEESHYAALIVYMPEEVDNVANFVNVQPRVELGITVFAQQADAEMD